MFQLSLEFCCCGCLCIMCISFPGAPGIISASPYAGAGFPPTFAIPQAAGTVFRKLKFYIGFLLLKHLDVLKLSRDYLGGG